MADHKHNYDEYGLCFECDARKPTAPENDMGDLSNWTKNDLARVIVQALMNLDAPAKADSPKVRAQLRQPKARLIELAEQSIEVINQNAIAKLDA